MPDKPRRTTEPHDRLTNLANDMLDAVDLGGVKAIVLLTGDTMNGVGMSGWDDDTEAVAYMLIHLQAIMRVNGKELRVMTEDGVFL